MIRLELCGLATVDAPFPEFPFRTSHSQMNGACIPRRHTVLRILCLHLGSSSWREYIKGRRIALWQLLMDREDAALHFVLPNLKIQITASPTSRLAIFDHVAVRWPGARGLGILAFGIWLHLDYRELHAECSSTQLSWCSSFMLVRTFIWKIISTKVRKIL